MGTATDKRNSFAIDAQEYTKSMPDKCRKASKIQPCNLFSHYVTRIASTRSCNALGAAQFIRTLDFVETELPKLVKRAKFIVGVRFFARRTTIRRQNCR